MHLQIFPVGSLIHNKEVYLLSVSKELLYISRIRNKLYSHERRIPSEKLLFILFQIFMIGINNDQIPFFIH